MTSRHRSPVGRVIAPFTGAALLAVSVAPEMAAQSALPRFERGDCLLNGEWARDVRRECGWLVVPESRDRASANTVRLAVEILRAKEPSGAPAWWPRRPRRDQDLLSGCREESIPGI